MCFDELDTVESMRGYTMLCFMYPTVTGVGFRYSWTMRTHPYVVFHVVKCYWWWWSWILLGNENTSVCCVSCGQVLLVVVTVRVSGVCY